MDDRRFDAFTRALGVHGSRRAALRTLLGLGGIAAVGGIAVGGEVRAARRPTPVSRPPRRSGSQTPCATGCCCPSGTEKCGSDCCQTGAAVCCDQACCFGICYGEELCCPADQIVCAGVCLPPGGCCSDFDCTGARCLNNVCVPYTPTNTPTSTPTQAATSTHTPTPVSAGGPCPGPGNSCAEGTECCAGTCAHPVGVAGFCSTGAQCCSGICTGSACA
jgi:hypothetical protein